MRTRASAAMRCEKRTTATKSGARETASAHILKVLDLVSLYIKYILGQ
jgi:hypothetical protein